MSHASRDMARAAKIPHTSAMRLVLASLFVIAFPALGQAQWTIAPTVSFGYGWSSGAYDYIGDEPWMGEPCVPIPPMGGYNTSPGRTCPDVRRSPMVPYGGLGIAVSHPLSSRLALAFSFDATLGSTHRIGQRGAASDVYVRQPPENPPPDAPDRAAWYFSPTYEIAYRGATSIRLHLGRLRTGYVGTGLRAGQRIQLGPPGGENPNPVIVREGPTRGATLEALLEGGVILGDRRPVNVGVILGAGRPLFRAELVVALPFTVGARR